MAETKSESGNSETGGPEEAAEAKETQELASETGSNGDLEPKQKDVEDGKDSQSSQSTFSYDQLKTKSNNPVSGIDFKRREVSLDLHVADSIRALGLILTYSFPSPIDVSQAYLSDEDFQTVFGMTKVEFYKLPKWKQDMQKRKADLF